MQKIAELEDGVTTEAEVRAKWGEPAGVYNEPDGSARSSTRASPTGQVNYMLAIGADGKMSRDAPGAEAGELREDRAGHGQGPGAAPARHARPRRQRYELKQEEVWDWRFADNAENKQFSVTFDTSGRVTATATTIDPRESTGR